MAAKVPTSIKKISLGDAKLLICEFDGTVSSNDIDDNDTWASGITSWLGSWWMGSSDNGFDVQVTSVSSAGSVLFDSAGSTTGTLFVLCRDM